MFLPTTASTQCDVKLQYNIKATTAPTVPEVQLQNVHVILQSQRVSKLPQ